MSTRMTINPSSININLQFLSYFVTDYICEGVDLTGVEIVEQDRRFVKQARKEVETQAQKMLEQGMETQVTCLPVHIDL